MSGRTPRLLAATLAVAALTLGACAEKTSNDTPAAGSSSAAATFPVTVGKLTLEKRPEKIVSLSPIATEMLSAVGAGMRIERLIGSYTRVNVTLVHDTSNLLFHPLLPEVVGGLMQPGDVVTMSVPGAPRSTVVAP